MAADGTRAWLSYLRESSGTVRVRTTAGAVLVVGIALVAVAATMVVLMQRALTEGVRMSAFLRADEIQASLEIEGQEPLRAADCEDLLLEEDEEFVRILDSRGAVLCDSPNLTGAVVHDLDALAGITPGDPRRLGISFEEEDSREDIDPFLAVAAQRSVGGQEIIIVMGQALEPVRESTRIVVGLFVIGIPVLLAVVGLVTWAVVGRSLAPVEAIRREVETISMEELHRRVPAPTSKDEIARLATTMNQMLVRLQEGQARQRRFVSDASHELRSPVASIRQHSEVVIAHPNNASAQELARVVLAEDLRMQRLVEDLLLLARMDERQSNGRRDVLDFDDVVFEEVYRVRQVTHKSIDTSRVSAGRVQGDRKQLSRLTGNILDNAVRHARGAIAVTLAEENGEVIFRVDDDGSGVPAAEQERIFERFVRLQEARDRDSGGAGLGLAIVAEVASAHGGTARILESHLGGASFEVRLPRASD
jgi:signal transduction histidine kinase